MKSELSNTELEQVAGGISAGALLEAAVLVWDHREEIGGFIKWLGEGSENISIQTSAAQGG